MTASPAARQGGCRQDQARPDHRQAAGRGHHPVTGTDVGVMGAAGAAGRPGDGGSWIVTRRVVVADGPPLLLIVWPVKTWVVEVVMGKTSGPWLSPWWRRTRSPTVDGC
jgi:hypothetical protein